jgi:hypothetical protein
MGGGRLIEGIGHGVVVGQMGGISVVLVQAAITLPSLHPHEHPARAEFASATMPAMANPMATNLRMNILAWRLRAIFIPRILYLLVRNCKSQSRAGEKIATRAFPYLEA